ncbi:MAG TPA: PstS family phosphate ABC transporter substrate-binding protein [Desulfomonilaceae bacterium]|nr:PstS family phosphate ABC transporter substrate-binding protein [Desulfomonilaceae bacterium]
MKRSCVLCGFVGVVAVLMALEVTARAEDAAKKAIRIHGATSVAVVVQPWAADYEQEHGGVSVTVYGSTDGKGLDALMEKRADIAMKAAKLSAAEKDKAAREGVSLEELYLCDDAVALIVHPSNPVNELTMDHMRGIFSGRLRSWKDVGGPDQPIGLVVLPPDTGFSKFLKSVMKEDFMSQAEQVSTNLAGKVVQGRPFAISYTRQDAALRGQEGGQLKILGIKKDASSPSVVLSEETLSNGTYPITRPLFLVYDKSSIGTFAREFLNYCQKRAQTKTDGVKVGTASMPKSN